MRRLRPSPVSENALTFFLRPTISHSGHGLMLRQDSVPEKQAKNGSIACEEIVHKTLSQNAVLWLREYKSLTCNYSSEIFMMKLQYQPKQPSQSKTKP